MLIEFVERCVCFVCDCLDPECVPGARLCVSVPVVCGEEPGCDSQWYGVQWPSQPADCRTGGILSILPTPDHR